MIRPDIPKQAVEDYFTRFLAGKTHQPLLPGLRNLSARFHIALKDAPCMKWVLSLTGGVLTVIERGGSDGQCGFVLETGTFLAIAAGELSPQAAFFLRKVEIQGEMALGLRLAAIMADFFRRFPYETRQS